MRALWVFAALEIFIGKIGCGEMVVFERFWVIIFIGKIRGGFLVGMCCARDFCR